MTNIIKDLEGFSLDINKLTYDPANTRLHNKKNIEAIKTSLARFGQRFPIVVQKQGMVVRAGNGRLEAAKQLGWDRIAAVVVDENDVQAAAFSIADNRTSDLAEWDDEALIKQLSALSTDDVDLFNATGFDQSDLDKMIKPDEVYTRKVETPIYEPKGNPSVSELFDDEKALKLIKSIEEANLDKDVSNFLKVAAFRHAVINFSKVADFYANQNKEVQQLMEDSALVIIDYDKAISDGFVKITGDFLKMTEEDENV